MAFRRLVKRPTAPARTPVFKLPAARPARMVKTIAQARPLVSQAAVYRPPTPVRTLKPVAATAAAAQAGIITGNRILGKGLKVSPGGITGNRILGKGPKVSPGGISGNRVLGKKSAEQIAAQAQQEGQTATQNQFYDTGSGGGGGGNGGGSGGGSSDQADEREAPPQQEWAEAPPQQEWADGAPQEQAESYAPQDPGDAPEPSPDGISFVGADEVAFPMVSSHVDGDKLKTVALALTSNGCTLVNCHSRVKPTIQGPVSFGTESSRALRRAIAGQKNLLLTNASIEKQREQAGELVERARQGDQNAMAIIALVRDNSKKGNPRAKCSYEFIHEYIQTHPIATFGADSKRRKARSEYDWACPLLANGPALTKTRISQVAGIFGNEEDRRAFLFGVSRAERAQAAPGALDDAQAKVFKIGKIIGQARKLQAVRQPNSRISAFDPMIGWELGE